MLSFLPFTSDIYGGDADVHGCSSREWVRNPWQRTTSRYDPFPFLHGRCIRYVYNAQRCSVSAFQRFSVSGFRVEDFGSVRRAALTEGDQVDSRARWKTTVPITVRNILGDRLCTYTVESDLVGMTGDAELVVPPHGKLQTKDTQNAAKATTKKARFCWRCLRTGSSRPQARGCESIAREQRLAKHTCKQAKL
eukprot:2783134-Rhodomonas_salina.4